MNDREIKTVLEMNDKIVKLSGDLSAMQEAIIPFVRLAQSMQTAIEWIPDDMETSIGNNSAKITVGDLRKLLEVAA